MIGRNKKLAAVLMGSAICASAAAQEPAVRIAFNIQPQPIAKALTDLGEQAGLRVLVRGEDVKPDQRLTGALHGELTVRAALEKVLADSGLTYEFLDDKTVRVVAVSRASPQTREAGEVGQRPLVLAQSRPRAEVAASVSSGNSEREPVQEILVTAEKRAERLIDVPQALTVLTGDDLARTGATQFRDFADTIPSLSYQTSGPGFTQISLRGVTAGSDAGATVGIYIDDVPIGSSTTFARGGQTTLDAGLYDLQRIEVLKGPQGTLYGATAVGGVIKYLSNRPDAKKTAAALRAGLANTTRGDPTYNFAGTVNIPFRTDVVALRTSGFYTRVGGYIDNVAIGAQDVNESKIYGGRTDLLVTPSDALSIRLTGMLQNTESNGFPFADYRLGGTPQFGSLESSRPVDEPFDSKFRLGAATIEYDLGPVSLTSVSSYQSSQTDFLLYSASTSASLGRFGVASVAVADDSGTDKFTQELRLSSKRGEVLEWLAGAFYTHEKSHFNQDLVTRNAAGIIVPNTFLTVQIPSTYNEYAAFGDLTWHLTQKFDITGGARLAHNSTEFAQVGTGSLSRTAPESSTSDAVVTYLGNARYHFGDRATGYLRYATGYRPGGPNVLTVNPATGLPNGPATFAADTLRSYELGYKFQSDSGVFGVDASTFHIDWNNLIFNTTVGGFASRGNAPGGAEIDGGELSLSFRPSTSFRMEAMGSYQDATMKDAVPVGLRAAAGERLPGVPRVTGAVSADYTLTQLNLRPTAGLTARYVGDRTSSYNASTSIPQYDLPSYVSIDVRAGLSFGSLETQLYVRNLTDERAQLLTRFTSPVAGPITVSILQPRTIGLNLSMQF